MNQFETKYYHELSYLRQYLFEYLISTMTNDSDLQNSSLEAVYMVANTIGSVGTERERNIDQCTLGLQLTEDTQWICYRAHVAQRVPLSEVPVDALLELVERLCDTQVVAA